MDLQLDKARLNRWARLLRAYLATHQQCGIKHAGALSAIAAMLDLPNANTLTARLRAEGKAASDAPATPPADGRVLHEISWAWSDPLSVFQTYAWLTQAERHRLDQALTEIAEEYGDLGAIVVAPRQLADGRAWHGNLAALVTDELKDTFAASLEDPHSEASRQIPALMTEPSAPPRAAPTTEAPDLDDLPSKDLLDALRRRGLAVAAIGPEAIAHRLSSHPLIQDRELKPSSDDLAAARDLLDAVAHDVEAEMTRRGDAELQSIATDQADLPVTPGEMDEIVHQGDAAFIQARCLNQPWCADGIFRVRTDSGRVLHVKNVGGDWVTSRDRADIPPRPTIGTAVTFDQAADAQIEIAGVPDHQPYLHDGVYAIADQYGERHLIEHDGEDWHVRPDTAGLD